MSVSYREDADVKHVFYGEVEKLRSVGENLSEIIDQFGASNKHLANKSAKESPSSPVS